MLIRTQDRKLLFDINGMQIYANPNNFNIIASNTADPSDAYILCGTYSTEEKAIKVLDMIQEKYASYLGNYPKVFEMPADESVEV